MRGGILVYMVLLSGAAIFVAGCGSEDSPMVSEVIQALPTPLESREDAHHEFSQTAPDVAALRDETWRYASDMDSLMGEMECPCWHDSLGTGMLDRMEHEIRAHHARMDSLAMMDPDECPQHHDGTGGSIQEMMRLDCDAHHAAMEDLLVEVRHMMRGMGR